VIVAIDIGNTETMIGLFEGREVRESWRIATERHRTGDEIALTLRGLLGGPRGGPLDGRAWDVERGVVASVVPPLDRAWTEAFDRLRLPVTRVDADSPIPVRLEVDEPASVGAEAPAAQPARASRTTPRPRIARERTIVIAPCYTRPPPTSEEACRLAARSSRRCGVALRAEGVYAPGR